MLDFSSISKELGDLVFAVLMASLFLSAANPRIDLQRPMPCGGLRHLVIITAVLCPALPGPVQVEMNVFSSVNHLPSEMASKFQLMSGL